MGTPDAVAAKAPKAPIDKYDPDRHDSLIPDLSPENRVAYRQAKLALVQAEAAYEDAARAAEDEQRKPELAFNAAKEAFEAAEQKLKDDTVKSAQKILTQLQSEVEKTKNTDLVDPKQPDAGKTQVARLQGLLDEYKASVAAVAAQMQVVDAAALALQKLSQPHEGKFNPHKPELNKMAKRIAKEQNELTIVQAQIPLDAARDAFELKLAELKGSKPRPMH